MPVHISSSCRMDWYVATSIETFSDRCPTSSREKFDEYKYRFRVSIFNHAIIIINHVWSIRKFTNVPWWWHCFHVSGSLFTSSSESFFLFFLVRLNFLLFVTFTREYRILISNIDQCILVDVDTFVLSVNEIVHLFRSTPSSHLFVSMCAWFSKQADHCRSILLSF